MTSAAAFDAQPVLALRPCASPRRPLTPAPVTPLAASLPTRERATGSLLLEASSREPEAFWGADDRYYVRREHEWFVGAGFEAQLERDARDHEAWERETLLHAGAR